MDLNLILNIVLIAAMVVLNVLFLKKGWNTGLLMLMNAAFASALARVDPLAAAGYAVKGVFSETTLRLVAILYFIMIIESIMRKTGMIRRMADNLKELVKNNRLAAGLMPLVIGLLPSPGGARFSCPLVEEVTRSPQNLPVDKAYVNYWFRHVWQDGFLLYPGIILASSLLKMPIIVFFAHLLPFIAWAFLVGTLLGLRRLKDEPIAVALTWDRSLKGFLANLLPVLYVIGMYIVLSFVPVVSSYAIEIASFSAIPILFVRTRQTKADFQNLFIKSFPVKLTLIILGVMAFKEVVVQSGLMDSIVSQMGAIHLPVKALFIILPLAAALLSGITVSYVSVAFPVLMSLGLAADKPWLVIATFLAGFMGTMTSPLHLCAVATADYFKAPLGKLLFRILVSEIFMAVPVILIIVLS